MAVMGDVVRLSMDELAELSAPEPTATWHPLPHARIMDMVLATLELMRFEVREMDLAVAKGGAQFFGTLDLATDITDGVTMAVGVRNSVDKSFAAGFCCGERVMVCSNLSFGADRTVSHKHTAKIEDQFHGAVIQACMGLRGYRDLSQQRIEHLKAQRLEGLEADSLLLRSFEKGLVGARILPKLIAEWREPSYEDFRPRNRWSLFNCFTHVEKERFQALPYQAAAETMKFQQWLAQGERHEQVSA